MAKQRKSRRNRRAIRKTRRLQGGAWYNPRTWFSGEDSPALVPSNTNSLSKPKSSMTSLFAPTMRNRTRSVSPVLPSQEGSRYLIPKTRFAEQNTVIPIPKLGSSPVGISSKTRTGRLRPTMAPNAFSPTSRGAENALVARYVAGLFQHSNSNQNMIDYLNSIPVAPHIRNRIEQQFMRNYGNILIENNRSTITNTSYNTRNNSTRRRNNTAAAVYGIGSSFMW